MRSLLKNTVFEPLEDDWKPDKVLAVLFHRSAATLYLIYFCWGISSIIGRIPSIVEAQGDLFQTVFSALVSIVSGLAFFGALQFPSHARLEMYSAASFATLVFIYEIFLAFTFFDGFNPSYGPAFLLSLSYLVIPLSRVVFIYVTLVKQAGGSE